MVIGAISQLGSDPFFVNSCITAHMACCGTKIFEIESYDRHFMLLDYDDRFIPINGCVNFMDNISVDVFFTHDLLDGAITLLVGV